MDLYEVARQTVAPLSIGGLQWKLSQPLTDGNSQAISAEIDYLVGELARAKEQLPFTLNQTVNEYVERVMLLTDCSREAARQIVNNLLTKNFFMTDEQIFQELNS